MQKVLQSWAVLPCLGVASPPELEVGAEANADHVLSGEDEEGPELGEEAQMVSC